MTSARLTAMLAFAAGQFDLTFPYEITVAMLKDSLQPDPAGYLRNHADETICQGERARSTGWKSPDS
jgi:hypothetical protein